MKDAKGSRQWAECSKQKSNPTRCGVVFCLVHSAYGLLLFPAFIPHPFLLRPLVLPAE